MGTLPAGQKNVLWTVTEGMRDFFTFFLMTIDPAHLIYNIQLTENVFYGNSFISKFSIAAHINSGSNDGIATTTIDHRFH